MLRSDVAALGDRLSAVWRTVPLVPIAMCIRLCLYPSGVLEGPNEGFKSGSKGGNTGGPNLSVSAFVLLPIRLCGSQAKHSAVWRVGCMPNAGRGVGVLFNTAALRQEEGSLYGVASLHYCR